MSKERILIVEDDADIREGVRILLESEDYMVDEAEDGREGLENLRDDTDLVILDIMMPGISRTSYLRGNKKDIECPGVIPDG